jgi:hypothetical protein
MILKVEFCIGTDEEVKAENVEYYRTISGD